LLADFGLGALAFVLRGMPQVAMLKTRMYTRNKEKLLLPRLFVILYIENSMSFAPLNAVCSLGFVCFDDGYRKIWAKRSDLKSLEWRVKF
jgi:hypothetical protein